MNKYSGNNKPYTYVSFPEGKKEKALSILEKLTASDEGKKLNFWYDEGETLTKKEIKRIETACSLLIFADRESLGDERFKQTVDTAINFDKSVMCVHLEPFEYETSWAKMQLGPQQAIISSDNAGDGSIVEQLKSAEIFKDLRVTKTQKQHKRRQMTSLIATPVALALVVLGYLFIATDIFNPTEPEPVITETDIESQIVIPFIGISGTQAELDRITVLCIYGDEQYTNKKYADNYCTLRWGSDDYSTFYVDPKQITEDNVLDLGDGSVTVRRGNISDLSWLQYLRNLETLVLDGQRISDISPIFELKKLRALSMRCNFIESLEGIEVMENLEYADFCYNKLTDVSSLFRCPKITEIVLDFNPYLSDLGCDFAPNVTALDVSFTKVEKIPVIGVGGYGVRLGAVQTRVTDFSFLSEVQSFNYIYVSGSIKSSLFPVLKDKNIRTLAWEYADIESMQELADTGVNFSYPGVLIVNRSELKSLEGIENIKGDIRWLTLFENSKLSDMSQIKKLPYLGRLGYDSKLERGRFKVGKYCEENRIVAVTSDEYASGRYMIWENFYTEGLSVMEMINT